MNAQMAHGNETLKTGRIGTPKVAEHWRCASATPTRRLKPYSRKHVFRLMERQRHLQCGLLGKAEFK